MNAGTAVQAHAGTKEHRDRLTAEERVVVRTALAALRRPLHRRRFLKDPAGEARRCLQAPRRGLQPVDDARLDRLIALVVERAWENSQSELWEVENRSRWRIIVSEDPGQDDDGQPDDLVLAPLERRITNVHPRRLYPVRLLVRHQILGVRPYRPARLDTSFWQWTISATVALAAVAAAVSLVWGEWARTERFFVATAVTLALGVAITIGSAARVVVGEHRLPETGPGDPEGYRDSLIEAPTSSQVGLWLAERATYLVVIAITVIGPALAFYHGTDLSNFLRFAHNGVELVVPEGGTRAASAHQIVGRSIQLVYCSVLSALPPLLYFLFDRQRLSSQRESWTRHLFHLNPHIWTVSEIEAAYGSRLDEAFAGGGLRGRLLGGRRAPLLVATIVITLGWTLLLLDTTVTGPSQSAIPYLELLTPHPSLVGFTFIGAYFFTLQFILRSFIRGDLRPKTYSSVAVRIVAGVTVAYLLRVIAPSIGNDDVVLVIGFFAGFVPDTVLRRIAQIPATVGWDIFGGRGDRERDLNLISGLDIYAITKLFSEGITNVETLAHTDPVDLIVRTRFPVSELIDWIDQALLLTHLPAETATPGNGTPAGPDDAQSTKLLDKLDGLGIRTATNLVAASLRDGELPKPLLDAFGGGPSGTLLLRNIIDNLQHEPVFSNVQAWRASACAGLGQRPPAFIVAKGPEGPDVHPPAAQPFIDRDGLRFNNARYGLREHIIDLRPDAPATATP